MARLTLEHCKYYQLPLLSVTDYIEEFKKKFDILLPRQGIMRYIKIGAIDHVYHEGRYYVVIESKSMESLQLPKGYKFPLRLKKGGRLRWVKDR